MSVLLLRYLPWLLGAAALFGGGTYAGWHANPWHGRYQSLQASDAIERAHGEEAVRKTLQAQLAQAQATALNNADSLQRLGYENAQLTHDRDANLALAHRLLNRPAARAPASAGVSAAFDQPAAATASGPGTPGQAEALLVDAADGYERCAHQLNALIGEIKPQL